MHDSGVAADGGHVTHILIEEGEHVLPAQQQVDLTRGMLALLNGNLGHHGQRSAIRLFKAGGVAYDKDIVKPSGCSVLRTLTRFWRSSGNCSVLVRGAASTPAAQIRVRAGMTSPPLSDTFSPS